ncbi:MAG: hypothetical protein V2A34_08940 [Lentisphaerota bacterium]
MSGFKIVDVRGLFESPYFQNEKSKKELTAASVRPFMPVYGVKSVAGWVKTPYESSRTGISVPSGTKMFSWRPASHPASECLGSAAVYYQDGAWIHVLVGASRDNHYCSLLDVKNGKMESAGSWFSNWCAPWDGKLPTIAYFFSQKPNKFCTYGVVVVEGSAIIPPPTPEPPKPDPPATNTWHTITIRVNGAYEIAQ